mgnify:CR=1 FL=1
MSDGPSATTAASEQHNGSSSRGPVAQPQEVAAMVQQYLEAEGLTQTLHAFRAEAGPLLKLVDPVG